jgi:hypothetical protein
VSLISCRLQQELHRGTGPHQVEGNVYRVYSDNSRARQLYHCTIFHGFLLQSKRTVLGVFAWGGHKAIHTDTLLNSFWSTPGCCQSWSRWCCSEKKDLTHLEIDPQLTFIQPETALLLKPQYCGCSCCCHCCYCDDGEKNVNYYLWYKVTCNSVHLTVLRVWTWTPNY